MASLLHSRAMAAYLACASKYENNQLFGWVELEVILQATAPSALDEVCRL